MYYNFCILVIGMFVFLKATLDASIECKLTSEIMNSVAKEVKREYGLEISALGSSIPDKIRALKPRFVSRKPVDISEARNMYIAVSQKLLNQVNSNPQIRPYLETFPFTYKNIDLMISYVDKNSKHMSKPHIGLVLLAKGQIVYTKWDFDKDTYNEDVEEPYEEALKLVRG